MKLKSKIALCLGLALGVFFMLHTTVFADDIGDTDYIVCESFTVLY